MPPYYGTRSSARHPSVCPSVYPNPTALRAFVRYIDALQRDNGGQPIITTPHDIARNTGIPESDQVAIRQQLMLAGRLRLSAVGNAWVYTLEARS